LDIVQKIWATLSKLLSPWCPKLVTGLVLCIMNERKTMRNSEFHNSYL